MHTPAVSKWHLASILGRRRATQASGRTLPHRALPWLISPAAHLW